MFFLKFGGEGFSNGQFIALNLQKILTIILKTVR